MNEKVLNVLGEGLNSKLLKIQFWPGGLVTSAGDRPKISPVPEKHPDNWAREPNQLEHLGLQTFFRKKYLKYCLKESFWTYTLEDFWYNIAAMG